MHQFVRTPGRNSLPGICRYTSCHAEDAEAIEPEVDTSRVFGLHRRARSQMPQSTVRFCPAVRGADGALAGRTVRAAQGRRQAGGSKTAFLRCSSALRPDEGDWSVQDPVRKQKPRRWRSPARSRSEAIASSGADDQPHLSSIGFTIRYTRWAVPASRRFSWLSTRREPRCGGRPGPASHAVRSSALCTGVRCRTSWINSRLDGML